MKNKWSLILIRLMVKIVAKVLDQQEKFLHLLGQIIKVLEKQENKILAQCYENNWR